ncbi:unnamed protein product [Cladocopium goreaui]|uniref:L-allo-threonine aldolase n=1 Tax=Cladocopium goreaui TaxID=2562237 RepID=A0A9P1DWE0_9DINO|nr:unnamed protein product [Cladocopium goreaui]
MQAELRDVAREIGSQDDRGAFLDILEVDPKNAQAFDNLGSTLRPGESLQLPDGLLLPKKALHLKALELDATHSHAHNNLAVSLGPGEVVTLQGNGVNQRALFQRAVELDPKNAVAHCNLGVVLGDHEVLRTKDGQLWDKRSLYVKAIELDPSYAFAYNNLAVLMAPQEWVRLADGSCWDRRSLYFAALQLDPGYAVAYNNLALSLGFQERVQCLDAFWDRRALHQKALELDPRHCCAYRDLALALRPKETVLLQGGTAGQCHGNVGRRELLLEAIRLEPSSAENYRLLAETLQKDEELMLNGFQMGKTQVFVRSLELDVDPVTCAQLGVHLGPDSCRVKGWSSPASWFSGAAEEGDNSWTGTQLIERALQLAPTRPDVLMAAATFELERPRADRTKARQLLLVAVAQGGRPNVAAAAGRLALLMEPGEAVRIPSQEGGATAVRRQLLLAACEEVDDAQLLTELALELLRSAPEVQLRGRTFDVRALCREALILDPHHSMAQQLLSHETKRTSPKPLLLRSAAPDLIQSSKDWQEPGFAPADAPKELDRFVLALVALEANKHEGALADALGELMGPADRVRLSEGQDGTASRYWQYRSRSQLHQAALEADPSSSRTWTNLGPLETMFQI